MRFTALTSILLFVSPAFAAEWRPYVGIGGLLEQPLPYVGNLTEAWEPVLPSPGMQLEAGVLVGRNEWYLAYHSSKSPTLSQRRTTYAWEFTNDGWVEIQTYNYDETSWTESRTQIGFRRNLGAAPDARWQPVIGAALSLGKSTLDEYRLNRVLKFTSPSGGGPDQVDTLYDAGKADFWSSDFSPGIALEFGVKAKVVGRFEASLLADVHAYWTDFREPDFWYEGTVGDYYHVVTPSLSLLLRYVF